MQELINKVQELVAFELERANTIHPPKFNSMHEAYAVILEEYEEAKEEFDHMAYPMHCMWFKTKENNIEGALIYADGVETRAIMAAAELIQVAAMCRKARM